jgi:hypothetical protein
MRSYVEVAGSAKIKIEDHTASVTFSRVTTAACGGAAPP